MQMTAPDVVVYCDSTLATAMRATGHGFRTQTGVALRVFMRPGPQSLELVAHGARNDVVVTQANWMDQGAASHLVNPATRVGAWRDATVLAGRNAATLSALPPPGSLAGMLDGGRLAVIDPTLPGGPDGVALASRLGWSVPLAGEIDGPGVAFLLHHGRTRLGLLPRSAALADSALAVAATVPNDAVVYAAAASKNALSHNTDAFLSYLGTVDATKILQAAGLETS